MGGVSQPSTCPLSRIGHRTRDCVATAQRGAFYPGQQRKAQRQIAYQSCNGCLRRWVPNRRRTDLGMLAKFVATRRERRLDEIGHCRPEGYCLCVS